MRTRVAIIDTLVAKLGKPRQIEQLGGMSQGSVYRVRGDTWSVIAKRTISGVEAFVYRSVLPTQPELRRCTPRCLATLDTAEAIWLLLEDIPRPLPSARRLVDPELLAILATIHRSDLPPLPANLAPFRPAWPLGTTERTLAALPPSAAAELQPILTALREEAQPLFAPSHPLSGDPNPANWGLRDNGQLVLYDWERFCHGSPALDLAITVPGLGSPNDFWRVAHGYLALQGERSPTQRIALAREIALAKIWSATEFLAHNAPGDERTAPTIAWLTQAFPDWVRQLSAN